MNRRSKVVGIVLLGYLVSGVLVSIVAAADSAVAKGSPVQADICNKELKWGVVDCDRQFRGHQDTRKHAD